MHILSCAVVYSLLAYVLATLYIERIINDNSCPITKLNVESEYRCSEVYDTDIFGQRVPDGGFCQFNNTEQNPSISMCHGGTWDEWNYKVFASPFSMTDTTRKKRSLEQWAIGAVFGPLGLYMCLFICWDKEKESKSQNHPPSFKNCPNDIGTKTAPPNKTEVVVQWTKPTCSDKETGTSITDPALKNGGSYGNGQYSAFYICSDKQRLQTYCQISFRIKVETCSYPGYFENGYTQCDSPLVNGKACIYKCRRGYKLVGSSIAHCNSKGQLTAKLPTCNPISCGNPPAVSNGKFQCLRGQKYNAICSILCNRGFHPSSTYPIQCIENGQWSAPVKLTCNDAEPPVFKTPCPMRVKNYADRSKKTTTVSWSTPSVSDNTDGDMSHKLQLIPNTPPGSIFHVGRIEMKYIATDSSNNTAECQIEVTVEELDCGSPDGIFKDRYLFTEHCYSNTFGSTCDLFCKDNYQLFGNVTSISCEQISSNPAKVQWTWASNEEPSCNSDICPNLGAPGNGALSCHKAGANIFCTMQCNAKYDIPRNVDVKSFFVCNNNGDWFPPSAPDCTEKRNPHFNMLPSDLYYYIGNCSDLKTQSEIKENFLKTVEHQKGFKICPDTGCTVTDVAVSCGAVGRKRREIFIASRMRRSTGDIVTLHFVLKLPWIPTNLSKSDEYNYNENLMTSVWNKFENSSKEEVFNTGSATVASASRGVTSVECEEGTLPVYSPDGVNCAGCSTGTFYDKGTDKCIDCPIGTFQDKDFQMSCKTCPIKTSTTKQGCKSNTDCKDMCPAGFYSKHGTVPCSPCPKGFYQPKIHSTTCIKCGQMTTTNKTGSVDARNCKEYDLKFKESETEAELKPIEQQVIDLTVAFWTKCSQQTNDIAIEFSDATNTSLTLELSNMSSVTVKGQNFSLFQNPDLQTWIHYTLQWISSSKSIHILINGKEQLSKHVQGVAGNIFGSRLQLKVSRQKEGLSDCSMSGFHVIAQQLDNSAIIALSKSCSVKAPNALYSMEDLVKSTALEVLSPSLCDAINDCATKPCGIHTCVNLLGGYKCRCDSGFTGRNCEIPPNFCKHQTCNSHGMCINEESNFTCDCNKGYRGVLCEEKIINGNWTDWEPWTQCSASCEGGAKTRSRTCTNPKPGPDGASCTGESQDTASCNTMDCPECPPAIVIKNVFNVLNCTKKDDHNVCTVTCMKGYVFGTLQPQKEYICGRNTSYTWNAKTPACTKMNSPRSMSLTTSVRYLTLPCSQEAKRSLEDNFKITRCVQNGTCQVDVAFYGCSEISRKRRSVDTALANVSFTRNLDGGDNLDINSLVTSGIVNKQLREYLNTFVDLEKTGQQLNDSFNDLFKVNVNGIMHKIVEGSFSIQGNVQCMVGSVAMEGICVNCPPGTWYANEKCELCEQGYYQPHPGMTSCNKCPTRFTTRYIGSTSIDDCSTDDAGSVSNRIDNQETDSLIIPVSVTSAVVVVCLIIMTGFLIRYFIRRKARDSKIYERASTLSLNMIAPTSTDMKLPLRP